MKIKWRSRTTIDITRNNIKIGDEVICIKDLVMNGNSKVEAMCGRKYIIWRKDRSEFVFINESGEHHYIDYTDNKWFKLRI